MMFDAFFYRIFKRLNAFTKKLYDAKSMILTILTWIFNIA